MEAHLKDPGHLIDVARKLFRTPIATLAGRKGVLMMSRAAFDDLCEEAGLDPEEVLREGT